MFCENCGALLTGGGKFCPECGAPVSIPVQNQYKKELEQGGQAFAYLPDEEPVTKSTAGEAGAAKTAGAYSYRPGKENDSSSAGAYAYRAGTENDSSSAGAYAYRAGTENDSSYAYDYDAPKAQSFGYSDETIRAAEEELNRPSKADEYKKISTDWRDHVDSDRFRRQNEQGADDWQSRAAYNEPRGGRSAQQSFTQPGQDYTNQPGYGQADAGSFRQRPDMYSTYGAEYSDKSYIAAALLAFFLGGLGIHNFYLGYKKKAAIQLALGLLSIVTFGLSGAVVGVWALVDFIMILIGSINMDGDGRPLKR